MSELEGRTLFPTGPFLPSFFGRREELHHLANIVQLPRKVILVHGVGGIGKTALIKHFFALHSSRWTSKILRYNGDPRETRHAIDHQIDALYESGDFSDLIAIDYADGMRPSDIDHISSRLFNIKRTHAIFFISRSKLEAPNAESLELDVMSPPDMIALIRGLVEQYGLEENAFGRIVYLVSNNPSNFTSILRMLQNRSVEEVIGLLDGGILDVHKDLILPSTSLLTIARPSLLNVNEDLIERLRKYPDVIFELPPRRFEELLAELLVDLGYEVELTPVSADGGRDILAFLSTPHGRLLCLVEAKRYRKDRPVGVELVRQLYGTLCDENASSAMMVTTSSFTSGAEAFSKKHEYRLALREFGDVIAWINGYSKV